MRLARYAPVLALALLTACAAAQTDLHAPLAVDADTTHLFRLDDVAGGHPADAAGGAPATPCGGAQAGLGRFAGGLYVPGENAWLDADVRRATAGRAITVECWVKLRTRAAGDVVCRNVGYLMRLSGGVTAMFGIDGAWRKVTGSRAVPTGRWVHLAMTYDQATKLVSIYLDGRLDVAVKPEGLTAGRLESGDSTLRIGTNTWNPQGSELDGSVDEVRVSSVARTYAPLPAGGREPVPEGRNLLPNPSFEFGRYGWRTAGEGDATLRWAAVTDGTAGESRTYLRSLEDSGCQLVSHPFAVTPGRPLAFSVLLRADRPTSLRLAVVGAGLPPDANWVGRSESVKVAEQWQRLALRYDLPESFPAERVYVQVEKPGGVRLDVDGAAAVCGESTDYAAVTAATAGVRVRLPAGNTLDLGSDGKLTAELVNGGPTAQRLSTRAVLTDAGGLVVRDTASAAREVAPGASVPLPLACPTDRAGWFTLRVETRADGERANTQTYRLNVVAPLAAGDASSPLGLNTHMERETGAHLQHNLATLARYGVRWIRAWWGWGMAEKQQGVFHWSEFDRQYNEVHNAGMEIMPILLRYYPAYEQAWAGKMDKIQEPPYDLKQWGNFVEATVARYRGRIRAWEVWNEPVYTMDAATYAGILKVTYERVKTADPQALVVGFAGVPLDYLRGTFEAGAAGSLDVLSHHSYPQLSAPYAAEAKLHADTLGLLGGFQISPRIWHSEQGSEADGVGYLGVSQTEEDCAANLVQSYLSTLSLGVEKFFWFSAQTSPTYGWGVFYEDYVPRPRLVALHGLARLLQGRTVKSRLALNDAAVACVMLDGPAGAAAALWSTRGNMAVTLAGAGLQATDLFLNPTGKPAPRLELSLKRGWPVYVLARGLSAAQLGQRLQTAKAGPLQELPLRVSVVKAGPDLLGLTVRSLTDGPWDADVEVTAPGLQARERPIEVRDAAPGQELRDVLRFARPPAAGKPLEVRVTCTFSDAGLRRAVVKQQVAW